MSDMQIDQVLQQIRSLSAQMRPAAEHRAPAQGAGGASEFARLLQKGIDPVNQTQQRASALTDAFERGTPGVELPRGDARDAEGQRVVPRADRGAQPPGQRVPGHHEHADLGGTARAR